MAEQVLDVIARLEGRPPVRAGLRVRFGWSMITLVESGGELAVCEPDFGGDPLRDVRPGLETTLDIAAEQAALVRRLGVSPIDACFDQFVVVAKGALAAAALQLYRDPEARGDDSGWSITPMGAGPAVEDAATYDAVRVHALLRAHPRVLTALGLPPGFVVTIEGDRIARVFDDEGRERVLSGGAR